MTTVTVRLQRSPYGMKLRKVARVRLARIVVSQPNQYGVRTRFALPAGGRRRVLESWVFSDGQEAEWGYHFYTRALTLEEFDGWADNLVRAGGWEVVK